MSDLTAPAPHLPALFRPRVARRWALGIGALVLAASIVMAVVLPAENSHWSDRLGFLLFGAVVAWFCHRQADVQIAATPEGVRVKNLFSTARFTWPELFAVSFPEGDPWAHLDLANGDTVALMALQRADGAYGVAQARAFNALIARYGTSEGPASPAEPE
ncbi:MAG: PH domain-containing protein [Dermabacter sp.]|nr:PH domain-containing protein [Dermabacter sp.]